MPVWTGMTISARDVDHLSLTLSDPDTAAAQLQQLGFTLTPEGGESRCLCLEPHRDDIPNYIELLAGDPPGIVLALNVAETDGEQRTLAWETEDGLPVEANLVVGETGGPLPWLAVQHETPDAFMEPEWVVHPNGALALIAVHAVADQPKELGKALGKAWKAEVEEIFDGCTVLRSGTVEVFLWSPPAWQLEYKAIEAMAPQTKPSIVGVTLAVERTRPLQALLRANNVPFAVAEGDRVLTAPERSAGIVFEFLPQV